MQPLSYQMTDTSCWLASMLNGIIFLREGKRVPLLAYRLLHMLLTDDGVFYYKKGELENFNNIINAVGSCTDLNIKSYRGNEVEGAIKNYILTSKLLSVILVLVITLFYLIAWIMVG